MRGHRADRVYARNHAEARFLQAVAALRKWTVSWEMFLAIIITFVGVAFVLYIGYSDSRSHL